MTEFTMSLFEGTDDFLLHTGAAPDRATQDKIEKCRGEYQPERGAYRIPKSELLGLLDECLDYFSEESLLNIAAMLDSSKDKRIVREVRERSVSKSKQTRAEAKDKKKLKPIDERDSDETRDNRKEREAKEEREKKEREEREKKEREEREKKEREEREKKEKEDREREREEKRQAFLSLAYGKLPSPKELEPKGPKVAFEDDVKEALIGLTDEIRMKLDKLDRFIHKNL